MRLIDVDNLDFTFDRRCFSEGDTQYAPGVDDAIEVINNAPTISAVPVVRCLECVSRGDSSNFPAMIYCKRLYCYKSPEGYCDEGQRKEADHD